MFFFRFEDLTADPEKVLRDVYCFVLGLEESQLQGSVLEAAIKQISENKKDGQAVGQLYKPRKASSNSNLHRYDPEMLAWAKTDLGPLLSFFGYNTEPTNFFPDVPTHSGYTYTHFKELNKVSEKNAPGKLMRLNGDDKSQGDMNVRSDCDSKDCAEGMPDRNLFNFNYLIDKVTVRD